MTFEEQAEAEFARLVSDGAALGNMQLHEGWAVLIGLLDRLNESTLERMRECKPEELTRIQGECDAVWKLRRWLTTLPAVAEEAVETRVEDGDIDEDELRPVVRTGGGGGVVL